MAMFRFRWTDRPPEELLGGAITVGNFDGVHRGHRALVAAAAALARPVVAVTFDPPPSALLHPPSRKPPLTTSRHRERLLHDAGANHVVELMTEPGLLAIGPEAFFEDVVLNQFQARAMVEGDNFRFGRARSGNVDTLRELCKTHSVQLAVVPPVLDDGEPISSSRIRSALATGNVHAVARWLDRPYAIAGVVERGAQRGRTIGIPTVNLGRVTTMIPAHGVYAGFVNWNGKRYLAAINVGPNPSFGENEFKIEAHLLDFAGELYGCEVELHFRQKLRDVVKFESPGKLIEQLQQDVGRVRELGINTV